jgi:hypothetical protein
MNTPLNTTTPPLNPSGTPNILQRFLLALDHLLLLTPLLAFYVFHAFQPYQGYTLYFKLGGIHIITPIDHYTIHPRLPTYTKIASGQWHLSTYAPHLGQITLCDTPNLLTLRLDKINLPPLKGSVTISLYPLTLHFCGQIEQVGINLRAHSANTYSCLLSENSPSRTFDCEILSTPTDYRCTLDCKRADPGITDLKASITTHNQTPKITLSGKFYNINFNGVGTGYIERGQVRVHNTLIEPIDIKWQNGDFQLSSSCGLWGAANTLKQELTLQYLEHTLNFADNELVVTGPQIEGCLQNTPHFTINASRFLYTGDLVGAVMWTESFNKHRAPGYSTIRCNNFQTPDGYMLIEGSPTTLTAHIHQNGKNIYVARHKRKLFVACDNLAQFQPLLRDFVLKAGDCRIEATQTQDCWNGKITVWDAALQDNYRIPFASNNWHITGTWSYKTYLRLNTILENQGYRVRVRGCVKNDKVSLVVHTLKKNMPIRLLCILGPESLLRLLESRFFIKGKTCKMRTTIDITNLFFGWFGLLPI